MSKIVKLMTAVAFVLIAHALFAYNGGYENSLDYKLYPGVGYANNELTAREESGATIAANRYAQCKKLKSVDLTGVTSIGDAAFAYSALESVTIPASVQSMGFIAFGGCANLKKVVTSDLGWCEANKEPFSQCMGLKTLVIDSAPSLSEGQFREVFPQVDEVCCPLKHVNAWQNAYSGVTVNAKPYTLVYYLNDGTPGELVPTEAAYGTWVTVPAPTRAGCKFCGWKVISGLTEGAMYSVVPGVAVPISSGDEICGGGVATCSFANLTTDSQVVFSAIWELAGYSVEYYLNEGAASGTMPDFAFDGQWFSVPAPVRAGCRFKGWQVISGLSASALYSEVPGVALPITGPDVNCGGGIQTCSFANLASDHHVVLSAVWELSAYSIEYYLNGGSGSARMPTSAVDGQWVTVDAPTRAGCTFMGWRVISGLGAGAMYSDYPGIAEPISSSYVVCGRDIPSCSLANLTTGDRVILSAVWAPLGCFKIEYDLRGGYAVGEMSDAVTFGCWAGITAPKRDGYVFTGWSQFGGYVGNGAMYSVTPGIPESIESSSHVWAGGHDYCWVANLNGATGLVVLIANWEPVSAMMRAAPVAAGKTATSSRSFTSGYYRGLFADGSGKFDLLVNEFDSDGVALAYFSAQTDDGISFDECEAEVVGGMLVLTFEQGKIIIWLEGDLYMAGTAE